MRKYLFLVLAFTLAVLVAPPLALFAYISPGSPQGFVNDFAGMLLPREVEAIEMKLSDYAEATGNEIAVVTIPTLAGDPIEDYADKLFQEWGIGKAKEDNGVLLLIARDDREVRIEVGYEVEPLLTDGESAAIIQNVIAPAFRNGRYADGISVAVDAIIAAIGGEYAPAALPEPSQGPNINWFWFVFILPLWLASILGRSKSWWAGGVIGAIVGIAVGVFQGFLWDGIVSIVLFATLGFGFDYVVSRAYTRGKASGHFPWWIGGSGFHGGGHSGFGGGGFGGFGGGHSGGGGASGRW